MMIDSMKLLFTERHHFEEVYPTKFSQIGFVKFVSNPRKEQLRQGKYGPKLTMMRRDKTTLTVEFSAPKLKYGNNLEEIGPTDMDEIVHKLSVVCEKQGMKISPHRFYDARVLSFHPSKNIILTDGYTSSLALRHLSKVDVPKWLDNAEVKYKNGGHSLQFYSATNALAMYDKIAEFNVIRRKRMDLDKDFNQQLSLFDKYIQLPKEVFRMEVRLNTKRHIQKVLDLVGFEGDLTLRNVLQNDLCQKVLLLYWENFFGSDAILLDNPMENVHTWIEKILIRNPGIRPATLQKVIGVLTACADEGGIRSYRQIMESSIPKWQWAKDKALIEPYYQDLRSTSVMQFAQQIKNQLTEFEPFRFDSS